MSEIIFASQLSAFSVPAGNSPATVVLRDCDGQELFRNDYHSSLEFSVSGLDSILIADLRARDAFNAYYAIETYRPSGDDGSPSLISRRDLDVFYHESWKDPEIVASEILQSGFLIQSREIDIPAALASDIHIPVFSPVPCLCDIFQSWMDDGRMQSASMRCHVAAGGDVITVFAEFARTHAPIVVSLQCGDRHAVIRFSDNSPRFTRRFSFRNMFNIMESVWLTGVLSESPSFSISQAAVNGRDRILDIVPDTSYALKVSGLSVSQALRARRMIFSRETFISHLFDDDPASVSSARGIPVIVTDISGEISDNAASLCDLTVKFSTLK